MRVAKIGYIAVSAALCFFGVLLIVKPEISLAAFGLFTGIVLIIFGIIKIVGYLSRDLYRLAFQYDLACGILVIALGIMVILEPNDVIETICIAVGITFLMDGLLKIQISIDAKTFGIRQWWLILSVALLTVVIGVLLVFRTSGSVRALMVLLGISLLADGIMNLTTVLSTVKIIHHQYPDRTIEEEEIFLE
ncbi:MAG: HdeD family acid-resistance protein [Candidatus Limivicinus sp.]